MNEKENSENEAIRRPEVKSLMMGCQELLKDNEKLMNELSHQIRSFNWGIDHLSSQLFPSQDIFLPEKEIDYELHSNQLGSLIKGLKFSTYAEILIKGEKALLLTKKFGKKSMEELKCFLFSRGHILRY